jgi:hypothetical protein
MWLSALGNQDQSKLTVKTEITSKSVAVLAFESSSFTTELKFESRLVGWLVDEFVVMVRMVEIEQLMGEIAGPVRHLSSSVKFAHFMVM